MSSFIHGFRSFNVIRCSRTKELVLSGMQGQHLHNRVQKPAVCTGISQAMWMTDKAKEKLKTREKHDPNDCPQWDCTCGAYIYRLYKTAWYSSANVYAHVVCLEHTIIHKEGGRTNRYSVDYLIAPDKLDQKVYVMLLEGEDAPDNQQANVIYGMNPFSFGYLPFPAVEYSLREAMEEIANKLEVPILAKRDLEGCNICLKVNEWRTTGEIAKARLKGFGGDFDVVGSR